MDSPTVTGLVSETENTTPTVSTSKHEKQSTSSSFASHLSDPSQDGIVLPDGQKIKRPVFPANKEMYSRVPRE